MGDLAARTKSHEGQITHIATRETTAGLTTPILDQKPTGQGRAHDSRRIRSKRGEAIRKRKNRAAPSSCMRNGTTRSVKRPSPIRRPPARRAFSNAAAAYVASFRRYAKEPAAVLLLRNRRQRVALRLYERTAISDGSTYDDRDDASCRACGCHEHPDPWRRG